MQFRICLLKNGCIKNFQINKRLFREPLWVTEIRSWTRKIDLHTNFTQTNLLLLIHRVIYN